MLEKKVSVITGGGSGIGLAMCRRFASLGSSVALLDVNEETGREKALEIKAKSAADGGTCKFFNCDVSDANSVKRASNDVLEQFGGRIDILVNNAGVSHVGNIESVTEEDFDNLYSVNVKGCYLCVRTIIPTMVKQKSGVILNLASIASTSGLADRFAYSTTKGAVYSMTFSLAIDYVKAGIRCNCISPARVHTPFVDGYLKKHYPGKEKEMMKQLCATNPMNRMGQPAEIAKLASFLCSDDSAFITGCNYPIDGGFLNIR